MSRLLLTEAEREAFCPEITRDRALDYFYVFDNVPLHFVYHDGVVEGELTEVERRNTTTTRTIWTDAYNQYVVGNAPYAFLYRGSVLQLPLQVHEIGGGTFNPAEESPGPYATAEQVRANFAAWMASTGWRLADEARTRPPRGSWQTVTTLPDRTMRVASLVAVGNQALAELVVTWSEGGVLKETAFAAVLLYDADGTVLMDRSYIEMTAWPSARRWAEQRSNAPSQLQPDGALDAFFAYHRARQQPVETSPIERRNLATVEGPWLDRCNGGGAEVLHPDRFRMQLPLQKRSCNLQVARELAAVEGATADREFRLAMTYAKGNQVVAEGSASWTEGGIRLASPFISFFLLDRDGLIVRERRYLTLGHWPGAATIRTRLGLPRADTSGRDIARG
jgi:hypothetical protein